MYFHMPPKLLAPFSTSSTQHTDFTFCPNLVPIPKSLNTKIENFPFTPSSSGVPNKVFELLLNTHILTDVQMQMNAFLCPLLILNTPYPKHSAMMTRNGFKWRTSIWYLHVWGAFPSSRWYLSKHFGQYFWGRTNTSKSNSQRLKRWPTGQHI